MVGLSNAAGMRYASRCYLHLALWDQRRAEVVSDCGSVEEFLACQSGYVGDGRSPFVNTPDHISSARCCRRTQWNPTSRYTLVKILAVVGPMGNKSTRPPLNRNQ